MKITYANKNKLEESNNKSFFSKMCADSPFLIINTECGLGKYKFHKIGYNDVKGFKFRKNISLKNKF